MSTRTHDNTLSLLPDLEILPVRGEDVARLSALTARNFRAILAECDSNPDCCHLAAHAGGIPVGLLLSRRDPERVKRQDILSLMVTPLLRRQGVARALLAQLRGILVERGMEEMAASWSDRLPQRESLVGLLDREGWGEPSAWRLRMSFNVQDAREALEQASRKISGALARGLSSQALATLGPSGPEALSGVARAARIRGDLPGWADPDPWLSRADPHISQILRSAGGDITGWLLAEHQPALGRHAAPIGWAGGDRGAMLLAGREWLAALERRHGAGATLLLQPSYRHGDRVAKLLDRHFRPFALWADQLVISVRPLSDPVSSATRRGSNM